MATLAPEPPGSDNSITAILLQFSAGNREVEALLSPRVHGELRRLSARYIRHVCGSHILQPTALISQACTQPVKQSPGPLAKPGPFLRLRLQAHAAYSRRPPAQAPGMGTRRPSTPGHPQRSRPPGRESHYRRPRPQPSPRTPHPIPPPRARMAELHFFGGLNFEEIAEVLVVSERTIKRDRSMALTWLKGGPSQKPCPRK